MLKKTIILVYLFCMFVIQCGKNNITDADPFIISTEDQEEIISAFDTVTWIVDSAVSTDKPQEYISTKISGIKAIKGISNAWINDGVFGICFFKGGLVYWDFRNDSVVVDTSNLPFETILINNNLSESSFGHSPLKQFNSTGNRDVCLINQEYNEPDRMILRTSFKKMFDKLKLNTSFTVDTVNGEAFDINFIAEKLPTYGIIFIVQHGHYDTKNSLTWLLLGTRFNGDSKNQIKSFLKKVNHLEWINKINSLYYIYPFPQEINIGYFSISDKFFNDFYTDNTFPNSFFYSSACEFLKDPQKTFSKILEKKGIAGIVGWNDKTPGWPGFLLGCNLIGSMIDTFPLITAFQKIVGPTIFSIINPYDTSKIIYYPEPEADSLYFYECMNISGTWNNKETGYIAMIIGNDTSYSPIEIDNTITINQNECSFSYIVNPSNISRTGEIGGYDIEIQGLFVIPSNELSLTRNEWVGKGHYDKPSKQIVAYGTGYALGKYNGKYFTASGTSTATWSVSNNFDKNKSVKRSHNQGILTVGSSGLLNQ